MLVVKELFYSLQGEGHYTGTAAVFCRFSGCNKWSGRPSDKAKSACPFCDTNFVGGEKFTEDALVEAITKLWPGGGRPRVVLTGGEPALQLTASLISNLKKLNYEVAVETNGSVPLPVSGPYWVTVSPKDENPVVTSGHELKVLWPNPKTHPQNYQMLDFRYFYVQPIDDENYAENMRTAVEYCLANPQWALSLQQHKIVGIQ